MSITKKDAAALDVCIGKSQELVSLIKYSDGSIVSKTIVDAPIGTITLFAFDEGQKLSEHTAPYNAVVQVIDGSAELTIGGKKVTVPAGHIIIMPTNVPHAVNAEEKFKMLLTMIRAKPKAD
ncbi:MAG: cupin domain-containing protein [Sedimentisphaerales bacterium]|nr:cupin domain-containing protein [Sedimentisphaerales bacterium]